MDSLKNYIDLGYGIPPYAVFEILLSMRDEAKLGASDGFDYFVECQNNFHVQDAHGLSMSLLANTRCVGMEVSSLQVHTNDDGSLVVCFNRR